MTPRSEVFLMDCMEGMKKYPDNHFDLAIVGPPYGIEINMNMGRRAGKRKMHEDKKWDNEIPEDAYFDELFRVSKNQIIWGGNYFPLPLTKSWIFWDKQVPVGVSFADGELAWTSFNRTLRKVERAYSGFNGTDTGGKIHPTQKPVKLYEWLLQNYATCTHCKNKGYTEEYLGEKWMGITRIDCDKCEGEDKPLLILDTHMGSQSSRIAAYQMGFDYVGFEIDKEYFDAGCKRFDLITSQQQFNF